MSKHHLVRANINMVHDDSMTFGQRIADKVASGMGSWKFIIIQSVIVVVWIGGNLLGFIYHWDVYPFILLNLLFSTQAAYSAPVIMMSQNRQSDKDRLAAEADYHTNLAAKEEIETILTHIEAQDALMIAQHQEQLSKLAVLPTILDTVVLHGAAVALTSASTFEPSTLTKKEGSN